jgi:hypothetical protein
MRKRLSLVIAGAALVAASGTAVAGSNVSFGISFGVPVAPAPVYVAPPPVVYAPPPPAVYYAPARVYYAPAYYGPPAAVVRYRYHRHRHHW